MRHSTSRYALIAGVIAACGLAGSQAQAGISFILPPPPFAPAGVSYSQLAANWWKWAETQPAGVNPVTDTTGVNCGQGQSGSVWFLAGSFSGGTVTRTCKVPYGKTIVFPIVNASYQAFLTDDPSTRTESYVRGQAACVLQGASGLEADVDGVPVLFPQWYLEKSNEFDVVLPYSTDPALTNIFGATPSDIPQMTLSPGYYTGYYVGVSPLTPGQHKIHWKGTLPANAACNSAGFSQEVTYTINVSL
jgi:hypothetical protein